MRKRLFFKLLSVFLVMLLTPNMLLLNINNLHAHDNIPENKDNNIQSVQVNNEYGETIVDDDVVAPIDIDKVTSAFASAKFIDNNDGLGKVAELAYAKTQHGGISVKSDIDLKYDFKIQAELYCRSEGYPNAPEKNANSLGEGFALGFHNGGKVAIGKPGAGLGMLGLKKGIGMELDTDFRDDRDPTFGHNKMEHSHMGFISADKSSENLTALKPMNMFYKQEHGRYAGTESGNLKFAWDAATKTMTYTFLQYTTDEYGNKAIRKTEDSYTVTDTEVDLAAKYTFGIFSTSSDRGKPWIFSNVVKLNSLEYYDDNSGQIEIKYVERKTGKEIRPRTIQTAPNATPYNATKTIFKNQRYNYITTTADSAPVTGTIEKGKKKTITHHYEDIGTVLPIKYVYKYSPDKEIKETRYLSGIDKQRYDASIHKEIPGYICRLADNSAAERGSFDVAQHGSQMPPVIYEYEVDQKATPQDNIGYVSIKAVDVDNPANILGSAVKIYGKDNDPYNTDLFSHEDKVNSKYRDFYKIVGLKTGHNSEGDFVKNENKEIIYEYLLKRDLPQEKYGKILIKYFSPSGTLLSSREITGLVDGEYDLENLTHEEIPGYKREVIKGQLKGLYTKQTQEVHYQYQVEKGTDKVIKQIRYVYKNNPNCVIAPDSELVGLENEEYDARFKRKEIPGYQYKLGASSAFERGVLTKEDSKPIVYEYEVIGSFNPEDEASEIGQVTIIKEDIDNPATIIQEPIVLKGKYPEIYDAQFHKNIVGTVAEKNYEYVGVKQGSGQLMGFFSPRVDIKIVYQYKTKTEIPEKDFGQVNIKYFNIAGELQVERVAKGLIGLAYDLNNYNHPKRAGYKPVLLHGSDKGRYKCYTSEVHYVYMLDIPQGEVIKSIRYVYKNDQSKIIAEDEVIIGKEGQRYDATSKRKQIPGYEYKLAANSATEEGILTEADLQPIIYEYEVTEDYNPEDPKSKIGQVTIFKEDIDNGANILEEPTRLKGKVDEPYNTNRFKTLPDNLKDKYIYVLTTSNSAPTEGEFDARINKDITYQYLLKRDLPEEDYGIIKLKYFDLNGDLSAVRVIKGLVNCRYDLSKFAHPVKKGYKPVIMNAQEKGIYKNEFKEIHYLYDVENEADKITKEIKYVYKNDTQKEIIISEHLHGIEGEKYNALNKRKDIQGYQYKLSENSAPESGIFSKEDSRPIVYAYEVIANFEPEDNNSNIGQVTFLKEDVDNEANILDDPVFIKGKHDEPYNANGKFTGLPQSLKDKYIYLLPKKDSAPLEGAFEARVNKDITYQYFLRRDLAPEEYSFIYIKYFDESGSLVDKQQIKGLRNFGYDLTKLTHPVKEGYKLKIIQGEEKGLYTKDKDEIHYQYVSDGTDENVEKEVKHVYKTHPQKNIAESDRIIGREGSEYDSSLKKKQIKGYEGKIAMNSAPERGILKKKDSTPVIYEYEVTANFNPEDSSSEIGQLTIIKEDKDNPATILEEQTILKGKGNDPYDASLFKDLPLHLKNKYTYISIKEDSVQESGTFEAKINKVITYQYSLRKDLPNYEYGIVKINYLDPDGTIAITTTMQGIIGYDYDLSKITHPEREDYKLEHIKGNLNGTYSDQVQEVYYQYKIVADNNKIVKEIKYLYKHDTSIKIMPDEYLIGEEGEEYNSESKRKEVQGYQYKLGEDSAPERGVFKIEDNRPIVYIYENIEHFDPEDDTCQVGRVIVIKEDINNKANIIDEDIIIEGNNREPYDTKKYQKLTDRVLQNKYKLVGTRSDSADIKGEFDAKVNKQIIYQYELNENVPSYELSTKLIKYFDLNNIVVNTGELVGLLQRNYDLRKYNHPIREGYEFELVKGQEQGKYRDNEEIHYRYKAKPESKVIGKKIRYVYKSDTNTDIIDEDYFFGIAGENYNAKLKQREIAGHRSFLNENSAPEVGPLIDNDTQAVVYEYEPREAFEPHNPESSVGQIIVLREDIDNKATVLEEPLIFKGYNNTPYNIEKFKELRDDLKDHYEYKGIKSGSAATVGVFKQRLSKTVVYQYSLKKKFPENDYGKVICHYLSPNGDNLGVTQNKGLIGVLYDISRIKERDMPGYRLVLLSGEPQGRYTKETKDLYLQYFEEESE